MEHFARRRSANSTVVALSSRRRLTTACAIAVSVGIAASRSADLQLLLVELVAELGAPLRPPRLLEDEAEDERGQGVGGEGDVIVHEAGLLEQVDRELDERQSARRLGERAAGDDRCQVRMLEQHGAEVPGRCRGSPRWAPPGTRRGAHRGPRRLVLDHGGRAGPPCSRSSHRRPSRPRRGVAPSRRIVRPARPAVSITSIAASTMTSPRRAPRPVGPLVARSVVAIGLLPPEGSSLHAGALGCPLEPPAGVDHHVAALAAGEDAVGAERACAHHRRAASGRDEPVGWSGRGQHPRCWWPSWPAVVIVGGIFAFGRFRLTPLSCSLRASGPLRARQPRI